MKPSSLRKSAPFRGGVRSGRGGAATALLVWSILNGIATIAVGQSPAPQPAAPPVVPGNFVDTTAASKVSFTSFASHTSKKYLLETMGSGVALFDYDNDGLLDLFFVNGAPLADPTSKGTIPQKASEKDWNRLYHQKRDGTFEDVTAKAGLQGQGYGMGVAVGDYDNDGFEDLYVTAYGGNRLYHNNGDGTFTDVTVASGTGGSGWSTSAAWVDLDNDGLLDLVVLRYVQWDFDDVWCGEHRVLLPPGYLQGDSCAGVSQRLQGPLHGGRGEGGDESAGQGSRHRCRRL